MNRVAVIGMVGKSAFFSLDRLQMPGETVRASALAFEWGGKGFNQALAAARAGGEVSFLAAVGEGDREEIAALLDLEGIRGVLIPKDGPGAFAAIETDAAGANRVTVYQGPSLSREDLEVFRSFLEQADVVLLTHEVPTEINCLAAGIAKSAGAFVILNPAPCRAIPKELMDRTDLFTPNEHETAGLENRRNVIVTLGAKGCLIRQTGETVPAYPVENVADTTGAGDTFNGVLAQRIARGVSLSEAARTAVCAASLSTARRGVVDAIPREKEILEALLSL